MKNSSANTPLKLYSYRGIDSQGVHRRKLHSATNLPQAKQQLAEKSILITKIQRVSHTDLAKAKARLYDFFPQLTLMLDANISLPETINTLAQLDKASLWQKILIELSQSLTAGLSLAQAMQRFPMLFTQSMITFVQNGEATGALKYTLTKLAELLSHQKQYKAEIKKTLSYPLFLLLSTLLTGIGIVTIILPQYQHLFLELNSTLPWFTQTLLNICHWLTQHGLLLSVATASLIFILKKSLQQPLCQASLHKALLKIPLIKSLIKYRDLSQWCYLLSVAYQAQLPLLAAIPLANQTVNNRYIYDQLSRVKNSLNKGENLLKSIEKTQLFTFIALKMIRISETTGTTDLIFSKIAKDYQQRQQALLNKLTRYAEPIALLLLALLTGVLIAALYLPLMHFEFKT